MSIFNRIIKEIEESTQVIQVSKEAEDNIINRTMDVISTVMWDPLFSANTANEIDKATVLCHVETCLSAFLYWVAKWSTKNIALDKKQSKAMKKILNTIQNNVYSRFRLFENHAALKAYDEKHSFFYAKATVYLAELISSYTTAGGELSKKFFIDAVIKAILNSISLEETVQIRNRLMSNVQKYVDSVFDFTSQLVFTREI